MNYNKAKHKLELKNNSLIGSHQNRTLLEFQAELGIALRGGSLPMNTDRSDATRLISVVNLLNCAEKQDLVFSGTIYYN